LAVLQSLVSTNLTGYIWLAVVAVLLSLVAAYYYLRIVKVMYFDEPKGTPAPIVRASDVQLVLALNGALVLGLGLLPGGLMALCRDAVVKALTT
ncbi:MAG TPA: NADH:ubiquinone oxidoreductase subunit N, partial [Burkholderiaceae bacterium]|nr:NADH:ubiquinone oxidoreductase subunit N [Burkholderiaceae bacterium]